MSRKTENVPFTCAHCGIEVQPVTNGSYRNHCPACLYSLHVDILPGDRAATCGGLMRPEGIRYHTKKGYQILHRCEQCGATQWNKAARDTVQPDDLETLLSLPFV